MLRLLEFALVSLEHNKIAIKGKGWDRNELSKKCWEFKELFQWIW